MIDPSNVQKDNRVVQLVVRVGMPEDFAAVESLWRQQVRTTGLPTCMAKQPSAAADLREGRVLVAYLPDGRLASTVTVDVATSADRLYEQLGHEVRIAKDELPAVTTTRGCSLLGGAAFEVLRIITLEIAGRMTHHIGGRIRSIVGVHLAPEPHVLALLLKLGYAVAAFDGGSDEFHESCIVTRLNLGRFMPALELLGIESAEGRIPSYRWEGPRLFAQWLPQYSR
ncbi:MAG: hypothetical protein ABI605_04875 [Rhizobacter sp.]